MSSASGHSKLKGMGFSEPDSWRVGTVKSLGWIIVIATHPLCMISLVHDVTFRALLLAMMVDKLAGKIADVETAFLHGELEEKIFMECPQGIDTQSDDEILILDKCIYGLVQSARQ